jgi:hypothetical protein
MCGKQLYLKILKEETALNIGKKYAHLVVETPIKSERIGMVAHLYGDPDFGGQPFTPAWTGITKPLFMITEGHAHDYDEYLFFFGGDMNDITRFDAEAELYMGEEQEKFIITKPTVVYVPAKLIHCPLNFKVVNGPIMFMDISIAGSYTRT